MFMYSYCKFRTFLLFCMLYSLCSVSLCSVYCLYVKCTVRLPPVVNPIAVNRYIKYQF